MKLLKKDQHVVLIEGEKERERCEGVPGTVGRGFGSRKSIACRSTPPPAKGVLRDGRRQQFHSVLRGWPL